jgi:hypothetical protein
VKPQRSVAEVERAREGLVRTVRCPVCDAPPSNVCDDGGYYSHTGRYDLAASKGLVSPMAGVGRG